MTLMLDPATSSTARRMPPPASADTIEVQVPERVLDQVVRPAWAAVPPSPQRATGVQTPPARARIRPPLRPRTARLAGLVMFVGFVAAVAVEPTPDGPQPVLPFWADATATATLVALLGCWLALAAGRRSGLRLGAFAGVGLLIQTVLCPALDHHQIAAWWWAQLAVSVGIAALSVGLLAATRPAQAAPARPGRWRT